MGAKGVQREPQGFQHGDQRAPETARFQGHYGPRRHLGYVRKPFDGSYAQTDLQRFLAKTNGTGDSFLDCIDVRNSTLLSVYLGVALGLVHYKWFGGRALHFTVFCRDSAEEDGAAGGGRGAGLSPPGGG